MNSAFQSGVVEANGSAFHYLALGDGPLALLLHGFPDTAKTWRHLMPRLAEAGYRAVAPYMRGYGPTRSPDATGLDAAGFFVGLGADANALHAALGGAEDAVLIGHDWGAVATYSAALQQPAAWRRCVTMGVPPLKVLASRQSRYAQLKRSFYMWFFQMTVADEVVRAEGFSFLRELWADWSPGYDAREDLAHLAQCFEDPASLKAALGYYRAFFNPATFGFDYGAAAAPLSQPLLYLHGTNDGCIAVDEAAIEESRSGGAPGSSAAIVPQSGHFLHLEQPEEVARRIMDFLGTAVGGRASRS